MARGAIPVSGPGSMSKRTDQAPGQPIRVPTGLPYGQAKAVESAQQAVPLPAEPGGSPPPASAGPASAPQPGPLGGGVQPVSPNIMDLLAHPTQRPGEPLSTPAPSAPVLPTAQLVATLEQLIHSSDSIPANVMRLYQSLRREANVGNPF